MSNNPRVCTRGDFPEYPLLVSAFDVDPFFIVLNKIFARFRAKADLIDAACLSIIEPSEVKRLETCFTSS